MIGRNVRQEIICGVECEVESGIDTYDEYRWVAIVTTWDGEVIAVGDGAFREDAEEDAIWDAHGELCGY